MFLFVTTLTYDATFRVAFVINAELFKFIIRVTKGRPFDPECVTLRLT